MKEIFIKYKIVILRTLGILMLVVGFAVHFWVTPKEGLSKNEIATINAQRMESHAMRGSGSAVKKPKSSSAKIMQELKNKQKKQMEYLTIIIMLLGIGSLGYSFIKPKS
ncbi:MAG: hypothetical protein L3J10_03390 [Sulfurimonas sp.]|nr:hypothetical protein [Sulfurimonas sp.]